MNILILSDFFSSASFGGAGIVSFDEAHALRARGHEVSVITTTIDKRAAGRSVEEGITIYRIYSNYPSRWRGYVSIYNHSVVCQVREIISSIRPQVVHAQSIHTYLSYYCLKIARKSGARVFITMHDVMAVHYGKFTEFIHPKDISVPTHFDYHISAWDQLRTFKWRYNPFRNIFIRRYLSYAHKIFAVSVALKQVLADNGIGNVEVIYNGIDLSVWHAPAELVSRFKKTHDLVGKKVVLFSGWVTGAKGGDQLCTAMKKVCERVHDVVLVAVGRKDLYYAALSELAQKMGIADKVVFPGWLAGADLIASYDTADVVVFPSICFDTFGMVNLEAMASKKPVVSTCFGGAPEVVADGVTGHIVNPYDTETMAIRITDILLDPAKAHRFGEAGYERARKYFNKADKIDELLAYYS